MCRDSIRSSIWLVLILTLAGCGGSGDDDDSSFPITRTNYQVIFSPEQVIDAGAVSDSVTATASLSTASGEDIIASGTVTVSGATASAVTINTGFAGETGPVALALESRGGGTWGIPAGTDLAFEDFFRLEESGYYVSIETNQGELRGQILPLGWGIAIVDLSADEVVPAAMSSGSARAGLTFSPSLGNYHIRVRVSDINDVTSVQLREGIAGARSVELIRVLEQSAENLDTWGTIDINLANSFSRLAAATYDLLANGSLYLGVETTTYSMGELRGQILSDQTEVFEVTLSDEEVVTSGSPVVSGAEGIATVTWTDVINSLGVAVNTDITDAVSVSIHQGAPSEIGPPVLSLAPDVTLAGNWSVPVTELTEEQASAFRNGEFYVSIFTTTFPEGELRGQLIAP